jgi:hypothetical protein
LEVDEKELNQLTQLNRNRILNALKGTAFEETYRLLETEFQERERFHDLYVDWVGELTALLAEKAGDEAVQDFYRSFYERRSRGGQDDLKYRLPIEDLVRFRAKKFVGGGHDFNLDIREDDEKFIFRLDPCGSGGRLIAKSDDPRYRTRGAYPWSHLKANVPYYCVHCFFIWEIRSIETVGYPRVVYEIPEKPGHPCIQLMYKDPTKIPERYFERLGRKKQLPL